MDNILSVAVNVMRLSPLYQWQVKLVDDFCRVVIRSLQHVTEPVNMVQCNDIKGVCLDCHLVELLIGREIGPVHSFNGLESAGL